MKLRLAVFLIVMAFSVTLAVMIGQRLSGQALAVIVGVVAGVAASIPTSLIVVWLATRSVAPPPRENAYHREAEAPRIVVVQPPAAGYNPGYSMPPPAPPPVPGRRPFNIIGGDDE